MGNVRFWPGVAQTVTDLNAALTTITLQNTFVASHWGIDNEANEVTTQFVVSFKLWGTGEGIGLDRLLSI